MKVLVIDDESLILNLCERILEKNDHTALLAENGADGLNLCREHTTAIHAAIIDLSLEDMSGYSVIAKLREIVPDLPCIVSSGQIVESRDIPEELQNNTFILQKPYRPQDLIKILETILVSKS